MQPSIIVGRAFPLLKLAVLAATGAVAFALTRRALRERAAEKARPVRWAERVDAAPSLGVTPVAKSAGARRAAARR